MTDVKHDGQPTRVRSFKATLKATSPLKLSSGRDDATDSDVVVDAAGRPFIPGTTLAGIMRHYLEETESADFTNRWFGYLVPYQDESEESRVRVFDAFPVIAEGDAPIGISTRDGVKLDEFKTAIPQGKHDYQVVDAGSEFALRLQVFYREDEKNGVDGLLSAVWDGFQSGDIRIGGKTTRGFGRVELAGAQALDIDLAGEGGIEQYIAFDWGSDWSGDDGKPGWDNEPTGKEKPTSTLFEERRVELRLGSFLMIRDYGTTEKSGYESRLVNAETLCAPAHGDENTGGWEGKVPIIPGTSWAGAFRAHMLKVLMRAGYGRDKTEGFLKRVYGTIEGGAVKSRVEFSESRVLGTKPLNATRNAIDRFTGGAADQKLFTSRMAYPDEHAGEDGGKTELAIRWRKDLDEGDRKLLESLVDICVGDLQSGQLAVGGMTAVGAGVFEVRSVDGKEREDGR